MQTIGRYQVEGELGRGAMGVVYRAHDPAIGRTVAIKTIRLSDFGTQEECDTLRERLVREAQSAGSLSHPGIVTIHDIGREGELEFIVMEFVDGPTLEAVLAANQRQSTETLLRLLRETAAALDYAHRKGVVHRDIKPANVMIDEEGAAKIADFGVAKLSSSAKLTRTGLVIGTPYYMSPEQIQDKEITGSADQFSLAVMAYEMLTGERPFKGATLTAILFKIIYEQPVEPQRLNPRLGPQVEAVLRRGLAKNPGDRYESCSDFARDLELACLASRTRPDFPAPFATPPPSPPEQIAPAPAPAPEPPSAAPARSLPAGALVLLLAAAAAAGVLWWRSQSLPRAPAPASPPAPMAEVTELPETPAPAEEPAAAQPPPSQPAPAPAPRPATPVARPAEPVKTAAALSPPPPVPEAAVKPLPVSQLPAAEPPKVDLPAPPVQESQPPPPAPPKLPPNHPRDGAVDWSGNLPKNSILVIDGNHASKGVVSGPLPGVPVRIDIDPPEIEVTDAPGPANAWRRLVFRSGNRKYNHITIRWRTRD